LVQPAEAFPARISNSDNTAKAAPARKVVDGPAIV